MKIQFWAALGAAILAGSVLSLTAGARVLGGVPSRPIVVFRGFNSCHFGPFCRPRLDSGPSSARFRAGFRGLLPSGRGPSDDYAVDADEGFGTDDAFRFDMPASASPGNAYRSNTPEWPDTYDSDSR